MVLWTITGKAKPEADADTANTPMVFMAISDCFEMPPCSKNVEEGGIFPHMMIINFASAVWFLAGAHAPSRMAGPVRFTEPLGVHTSLSALQNANTAVKSPGWRSYGTGLAGFL